MPTYDFNSTNFSISFVNGNGIYYNTTKLSEEDVTTSSTDSQEQDHVKEINQTIPFEEAMGF